MFITQLRLARFLVGFMHSRGDLSVIFGVYSALGCDILLYYTEYCGCLIQSTLELDATIIVKYLMKYANWLVDSLKQPSIRDST